MSGVSWLYVDRLQVLWGMDRGRAEVDAGRGMRSRLLEGVVARCPGSAEATGVPCRTLLVMRVWSEGCLVYMDFKVFE